VKIAKHIFLIRAQSIMPMMDAFNAGQATEHAGEVFRDDFPCRSD
jgi:hypothetical protein